jgi:hypothetical protein
MIMALYLLRLSLIALSPAAAWYFIVILSRFFAPPGEKTIQKELIMAGKRKSYLYLSILLSPGLAKKNRQGVKIREMCPS